MKSFELSSFDPLQKYLTKEPAKKDCNAVVPFYGISTPRKKLPNVFLLNFDPFPSISVWLACEADCHPVNTCNMQWG